MCSQLLSIDFLTLAWLSHFPFVMVFPPSFTVYAVVSSPASGWPLSELNKGGECFVD